jgi:hypothetical protein
MRQRILSITFAISLCLLAARSASADSIDFQSAVGSGGGQSGGAQASQSGGGSATTQVQTVDFGDVTGTVCDCGEIAPAGDAAPGAAATKGGFPKIPLYAFAVGAGAIPTCFFTGICTREPPRRNPPPSDVPEPLTLATLTAGLAALSALRARRRI